MRNPLKIALPVMLHKELEIDAFKAAQERLTELGAQMGTPLEVGAFALYLPGSSRTPEAFAAQIANQKKHRLPMFLVETGVQQANALSYGPGDPTFNPQKISDLERTLDHVATLRDNDPNAQERLVVAPHVGLLVVDSLARGDFSLPSYYSPSDFVSRRDELYDRIRHRVDTLSNRARKEGLQLAIENAYSAVFENAGFWEKKTQDPKLTFGMNYQVFQDIRSLVDLSRGNLVLDLAHLSSMQAIPARFKQNADVITPETLFATLGITSWAEFSAKVGKLEDYLPYTRAFHLSPVDGLGIRVPKDTEIGRRWGDGTGKDLTGEHAYISCISHAHKHGMPIAIEADYSFKPLTYNEAPDFLRPLLEKYGDLTRPDF